MLEKGIKLVYNTTVFSLISKKANSVSSGAREIKNVIRKDIVGKIVDLLLNNSNISEISIDTKEKEFVIKPQ